MSRSARICSTTRVQRVVILVLLSWLLLGGVRAQAALHTVQRFDIPAQATADALNLFSKESGLRLLFSYDAVKSYQTAAIVGDFTAEDVLRKILSGTNLEFEVSPDSVILIRAPQSPPTTQHLDESVASEFDTGARLAQAGEAPAAAPSPAPALPNAGASDLMEVIVTAQKRSERLTDVPASITAITGASLESLEVRSLSDLAGYVPGLSVMDGGSPGFRTLVIRGLNTSYNNQSVPAMVGTYVDDLPVGSSSSGGRGANYGIDLVPYDIQQVEVLEGPQGTLYGANTMGGLIKYVLRKPSLTAFEARVGADLDYTDGSGQPSKSVRAAVNVPLVSGLLGLRLSGFTQHYAGYIDNVGTGGKDVNASRETGGRATLLWEPTERISVQATAAAQDIKTDSMSGVTLDGPTLRPAYGNNKEKSFFAEPFKQKSRIYSLSAKLDLDFATLSSSTGWSKIAGNEILDLTDPFGIYVPYPNALTPATQIDEVSKIVEEVRLTSPEHQRLKWMLGGYYTRETSSDAFYWPAYTPTYVPLPPQYTLLIDNLSGTYKEAAAFANITYTLTEGWDLTGGLRHSSYSQTGCHSSSGIVRGGVTLVLPCTSLPNTGVTLWLADTSYHVTADSMAYFRVSTGYRPGSGCPSCGNAKLGIPGIVDPDKTKNYEIGFKGQALDRTLQFQVSAFYVDWTNIQINILDAQGLNDPGNGSGAHSTGFELSTAWRAAEGLQLSASLGYADAHLTEDVPATAGQAGGKAGDQLPNSPRWSGTLMLDYSHPLYKRLSLLSGASYRYRDAVVNQFAHSGSPLPSPPQNIVDLYAGTAFNELTVRLNVKNVFNNRSYSGLVYVSDAALPRYVPVLPRTIGISADYQF